jgi:hypothetical protein
LVIAGVVLLAAAGTAAAVLAPAGAFAGPPPPSCNFTADWMGPSGNPLRLVLFGELLSCDSGTLGAHVFRNGVEVAQPGSGGPSVTWVHDCVGIAPTDWRAVWNTGLVNEGIFNCG